MCRLCNHSCAMDDSASDCPSAMYPQVHITSFQMTDLQLMEQEKSMRTHVKILPDGSYLGT